MTSFKAFLMRSMIKVYQKVMVPRWTKIGKHVFIGRRVHFDRILHGALITIEDGAHITSGVTILCHDVSYLKRTGLFYAAPVLIGRNSFIGINSIILPGVKIGENAIVGAGSVVTRDVPPNTLVAGVPAKEISNGGGTERVMSVEDEGKSTVPFSRCHATFRNKETKELIERAYNDWGFIIKGW